MKPINISIISAFAIGATIVASWVAGCSQTTQVPPKKYVMEQISGGSYPKFTDDMAYDGLAHSISKNLSYLKKIPLDRQFAYGKDHYTTEHLIQSSQYFLDFIQTRPTAGELNHFILSSYRVYRSIGRDGLGEVLYTGYYEPHLRGTLSPSGEYRFPIYAKPPDLINVDLSLFKEEYAGERIVVRYTDQKILPYYDRSEIDYEGVLKGNTDVLAWVDDPIDVFFLQIQGSGKIYLDSGDVLNVHYHTSNGRPYRSIGKLLIDRKKISVKEMSMQKIREYLNSHPDEIKEVFNYNPSYVFFENEPNGPLGNINVKLTPGRSIALDRRIFPKAALCFIEAEKPMVDGAGQIQSWRRFARFAMNQDTGGAIRGPGRADIFWGNGPYAEIAAGHLKHTGNLYFLVLKSVP
jgi:membrane-bound lytic murein transglycosylase A